MWHDLITVIRYRRQYLPLDSALEFTRGNPFSARGLLEHINSGRESFTAACSTEDELQTLIGQVYRTPGAKYARLAFLMPAEDCQSAAVYPLVEGLSGEAARWGAFQLLAEVKEDEPAFSCLRRAGFCVYGWQRVWKLPQGDQWDTEEPVEKWRQTTDEDGIAVRGLYNALVPPLVQRAEPVQAGQLNGFSYFQEGELLGFVEGRIGPVGIYLQPLLHPAAEKETELIRTLPGLFQSRAGRLPVYLVVRSYQAWLEKALIEMGAGVSARQALLVKYLTVAQRFSLAKSRLVPVLETAKTETSPTVINHIFYNN